MHSAHVQHGAVHTHAVWYKNQGKYLYQFCAKPFEELEGEKEEEDGEIRVLAISCKSLIVVVTFESVIVYRNTHRLCYVSKRAYSCSIQEF